MTTYYVRKSGNNSNPGTNEQPRQTIASGMALLSPGDTLIVGDGTYAESLSPPNGQPGAWITIKAENKRAALLRPVSGNGFSKIDAHHIVIDGFDIKTNGDTHCIEFGDHTVHTNNNARYLEIRNNRCHNTRNSGISVVGGEFYTIEDNECAYCAQGSWYSGISVYQCRNITGDTTTPGPRVIIRRNTCYGSMQSVGPYTDGNGIICDDWQNNQNESPFPPYTFPGLVENNLCYHNGGKGIQIAWSDNVVVRNNICYWNNRDQQNPGTWKGDLSNQDSKNCIMVNNIAWCNPAYGSWVRAIGVYGSASTAGSVLANNITFNGTPGQQSIITQDAGSYSNGGGNLFGVNPQLTNPSTDPATADFRPATGSPAINAGTATWGLPPEDITGNDRVVGGSVDIGAFEIGSGTPPPPSKPVINSVSITPQEGVFGDTFTAVVDVEGEEELAFQWLWNGEDIPGETGLTCTLPEDGNIGA